MTKKRDHSSGSKTPGSDTTSKKRSASSLLGKKPHTKTAATKTKDNKKDSEKKFAFESDSRPRFNSPQKNKSAQPLTDMRMGELVIERIAHDGRGIAYWHQAEEHKEASAHQGKIVLVKQALTGERVSARLVKEHSRFLEARVEKLIESSPERIAPACEYFARCGGCQLQHMPVQFQLDYKQAALAEQLGVGTNSKQQLKQWLAPIESPNVGYRRAARLSVNYAEGFAVGFREENSRTIVDIKHCTVLTKTLNDLVLPLRDLLNDLSKSQAITHVELLDAKPAACIIFRTVKLFNDDEIIRIEKFAQIHSVKLFLQTQEGLNLFTLNGESVDPRLSYALPKFSLQLNFHPRDFIQVNASVNEAMVSQAVALLKLKGDERVLDLFCGIGNFTLALARQCKTVIGIEAIESMVERGRENARLNEISNAEFIAADLTKMTDNRLRQVCGRVDAVLLDPPRDGAKEIVEKLAQLSPTRIVYVSCNPATLARDAKTLQAAGYELRSLGVMDMFPQTAHLESMALFIKR